MGRRHFRPEQIIHMLREVEIKLAGARPRSDTDMSSFREALTPDVRL